MYRHRKPNKKLSQKIYKSHENDADSNIMKKEPHQEHSLRRNRNFFLYFQYTGAWLGWILMSLTPLTAECHDTGSCDFHILTGFMQPHCLCSRLSTEICQNLESIIVAILRLCAQFTCTNGCHGCLASIRF